MKDKILIIGGCGYIGSRLYTYLKENKYDVETLDLEKYGNIVNANNVKRDYSKVSKKFFNKYQIIILLAGYSSVKMCKGNMLDTFNNNVVNFVNLLNKLDNQILIYASSASVYGGTKKKVVSEDYDRYTPSTYYDLSKKEIDYYAQLSSKNIFGLRLGTVCGYSPNLRTDVMINKMYESALRKGEITIFNSTFNRPILGFDDLCRSIEKIIKSKKKCGIYNIVSFNMNIKEIAKNVAKRVDDTKIIDIGDDLYYYSFSVSNNKFEDAFNFKFKDNIESILQSLEKNYDIVKLRGQRK